MPPPEMSLQQRLIRLLICLLPALIMALLPVPDGIRDARAWGIFGVFVVTIFSFILRPYPMGSMVLFGLLALAITKQLTLKEALKGYGNTTVWLVVGAFLIAGGVTGTGFGRRIALTLVRWLGKSLLGLGYAICGAELILGPVVPSNTARGGGILAPIADSLSRALDSTPENNPERAGQYLNLVGAHANLIAAAMFLTGMAANPLVSKFAYDVFKVEFGWGQWALGALVPGLISFAILPPLIRFLVKPELTDVSAARKKCNQELEAMGNWSQAEKIMCGVFGVLILLWSTKAVHGMGTALVALIGVALLLLTQAVRWKDMVRNYAAWDALVWLGGLLTMANALRDYGLINWFAKAMQVWVQGYSGLVVILILAVVYFYSMYGFSMLTAHISAMAAAFMTVALSAGAPPLLTIALLAYFSNLCACLTNYSTGPLIIYFGQGYVTPQPWFRIGFLISLVHMVVWLGGGLLWWKVLGWW